MDSNEIAKTKNDDLVRRLLPAKKLDKFSQYRLVFPLLSRWADENFYLSAMLRTHFNQFLESFDRWLKPKLGVEKTSILDLKLCEIEEIDERINAR